MIYIPSIDRPVDPDFEPCGDVTNGAYVDIGIIKQIPSLQLLLLLHMGGMANVFGSLAIGPVYRYINIYTVLFKSVWNDICYFVNDLFHQNLIPNFNSNEIIFF